MSAERVGEIRVLAVDDNADLVEVVGEFLEREHDAISVRTATSGDEALDKLTAAVDCIVSDYDMPGKNGLELLRAVRDSYPDLPFILFTGKGSEEIASEAISAGVTEYLQKGTATEQYMVLANRIERAVSERRARAGKAESERRFATLVENIRGMAYRCRNAQGWPMEYVSSGCEELTGYTTDQLESGDVVWGEDILHPDDRDGLWELVQQAIDADDPFEVTYRIERADGDVRWCWERGQAVKEDGETVALEGLITDITERKRREQELKAEREFTDSALNALKDVFFVIDPESKQLLRWNDRYSERLGYGDETLETLTVSDLVADEHIDRVREAMEAVISAGSVTVEADLVTADGERIPHEFRGTALYDGGDLLGIAGVGRDISDRVDRERRLEEYRTLVENVGDPMYLLDAEGYVQMINSAMVEHIGYTREEIAGKTPAVFMPDEDVERGTEVVADLLRSDERGCTTWEMDVITKDGTFIHSETQTSLLTENGEYVGTAGIIRDVTERRERERELERFETVVQAVGDPVYALDENGEFTFVNDAMEGMTGYDCDTLVGAHIAQILPEDDVTRGREEIREILRDPRHRARKLEVDVETASGERIPSELHIAALPMDESEFHGTAGIIRDITERKQREERLEQFAGVVSHDLRNPLNVIQGHAAVAQEHVDHEDIDAIATAADRMEELIDDLLTLSRQGDSVGETETVPLDSIAKRAWSNVDAPAATLDQWTTDTVDADPERLQEILENLFRNAVEHGGEDIHTSVGSLDDDEGFFVEDDGPGIPVAERGDVFDHGYTTSEQGTGFGLSIVERIAKAHGWSVAVTESEAGGARFEFRTG